MSYGLLHNVNRSRHTVDQLGASPAPPIGSELDPEDEVHIDLTGRENQEDNFELKDLSGVRNGTEDPESSFDHGLPDSDSDDEKSPGFGKSRRTGASTVQSFMLYTADEERSVIKKFDRRLVLFIAFLYMLSFLDRSSR